MAQHGAAQAHRATRAAHPHPGGQSTHIGAWAQLHSAGDTYGQRPRGAPREWHHTVRPPSPGHLGEACQPSGHLGKIGRIPRPAQKAHSQCHGRAGRAARRRAH
eukprot:2367310-Lingulodinium_polyedra.AAC.1